VTNGNAEITLARKERTFLITLVSATIVPLCGGFWLGWLSHDRQLTRIEASVSERGEQMQRLSTELTRLDTRISELTDAVRADHDAIIRVQEQLKETP
jgi:hypothetical protein